MARLPGRISTGARRVAVLLLASAALQAAWSADSELPALRLGSSGSSGRVSLGDRALNYWTSANDLWPAVGWTLRFDGTVLHSAAHTARDQITAEGPAVQRAALSSVYFSTVSGLRATGGVLGLSRNAAQRLLPASGLPSLANVTALADRSGSPLGLDSGLTLPYLGVGYSNRWLSGPSSAQAAWSVSADFGLLAASPRSAVRLGQQGFDDTVRELRLAPLLQFGVSYTY